MDFVRIGFPGKEVQWFENPQNKGGHWKAHVIHATLGNESAGFYDIDGDGRLDILGGNPPTGEMIWLKAPDPWENLSVPGLFSLLMVNFLPFQAFFRIRSL